MISVAIETISEQIRTIQRIRNKLSVPRPVLRKPGYMFVSKTNMWTGFVGSRNGNGRTPTAFFRNLEVARWSEIPLEI
jgi:hypothetical protein